jgi:hypothetical protein
MRYWGAGNGVVFNLFSICPNNQGGGAGALGGRGQRQVENWSWSWRWDGGVMVENLHNESEQKNKTKLSFLEPAFSLAPLLLLNLTGLTGQQEMQKEQRIDRQKVGVRCAEQPHCFFSLLFS